MRLVLLVPLMLFVCAACAQTTAPTDPMNRVSPKLEAAYHWQVLAGDVARRINDELIRLDMLDTALTVKRTCGDDNHVCADNETSSFNEAFHDLLLTELVALGAPVRPDAAADTLEVSYKTQTVRHDAFRLNRPRPGMITALTAAVMVLRNAPTEVISIATGGAVDYAVQNMVAAGHYEVIITTSIGSGNRYLFRASDIYAINDADYPQYLERQRKSATAVPMRQGGAAVSASEMALPAAPRSQAAEKSAPPTESIIPIPEAYPEP
ncbi:MAG: hypothetical protein LBU39_07210 [Desulfobulbaceae bacterium]|nr:hypothetical protein [Desulfobulbaceae bacterium]